MEKDKPPPISHLCPHGFHMRIGCPTCDKMPDTEHRKSMNPLKKALISSLEQFVILEKETIDNPKKLSMIKRDIRRIKYTISRY